MTNAHRGSFEPSAEPPRAAQPVRSAELRAGRAPLEAPAPVRAERSSADVDADGLYDNLPFTD